MIAKQDWDNTAERKTVIRADAPQKQEIESAHIDFDTERWVWRQKTRSWWTELHFNNTCGKYHVCLFLFFPRSKNFSLRFVGYNHRSFFIVYLGSLGINWWTLIAKLLSAVMFLSGVCKWSSSGCSFFKTRVKKAAHTIRTWKMPPNIDDENYGLNYKTTLVSKLNSCINTCILTRSALHTNAAWIV